MTELEPLPEESDSQRIGHLAVKAFDIHSPINWRSTHLDGDADAGFDVFVQVIEERRYSRVFHAQIKGSEDSSRLNADKTFYSVSIKTRTINYYARVGFPVMLVFCDLSSGEGVDDTTLYYLWIHDEIKDLLDGRCSFSETDQKSFTFRVPRSQVLNRELDVLSYLQEREKRIRALDGLASVVTESAINAGGVSVAVAVRNLTETVKRLGISVLGAEGGEQESPWLRPTKGTLAEELYKASQSVTSGEMIASRQLLSKIEKKIELGSQHEKAEYFFIKGRFSALEGDDGNAEKYYKKAHEAYSDIEKYNIALVETQFRNLPSGDVSAIRLLMEQLSESADHRILCLKARMLSVLGAKEQAISLLSELPLNQRAVAEILVLLTVGDNSEALGVCQLAIEDDALSEEDIRLVHLLKARCHFNLALGNSRYLSGDKELPATGAKDIDFEQLHLAWDEIAHTRDLMRAAGWPRNLEYFVDIWVTVGGILGHLREIVPELEVLARARAGVGEVQEALFRAALNSGSPEVALDAIERQPDSSERVYRKIYALYAAGRKSDVVDLASSKLLSMGVEDVEKHGMCLGIACLCASDLVRDEEARLFLSHLESKDVWRDYAAIQKYFSCVNSNLLGKERALEQVKQYFRSNPGSAVLQDHLLLNIKIIDDNSAIECIDIAIRIQERRALGIDEIAHLSQAHIKLQDFRALDAMMESAIKQYGNNTTILGIKALVLELSGNSSAALELLGDLVQGTEFDEFVITAFINISMRCGFVESAIRQIEKLLVNATDRSRKLELIRTLFTLEVQKNPTGARLQELAWRYGGFSDQDDEIEEGIFLQLLLFSTLSEEIKVSEDRKSEFHRRSVKYFEKFPNSSLIKSVELPRQGGGGKILSELKKVVGLTEARKAWYEKAKNELRSGDLVAPFSWRPRVMLNDIPDVSYLWEISKRSNWGAREYHLRIGIDGIPKHNVSRGVVGIPLIDIPTLLLIADLGVFDIVFQLLGKIAVTKKTLTELQQLGAPISGSIISSLVNRVLAELKQRVSDVFQPGTVPTEHGEDRRVKDGGMDEIKGMLQKGGYCFYSDDAYARSYMECSDQEAYLCTVNILEGAESRGLMSVREVAHKLSTLCAWKIEGLPISARYFFACLPEDVESCNSIEHVIEKLDRDEYFKPMVDALWEIGVPYESTSRHLADLVSYAANQKKTKDEIVCGIWGEWLDKVRLRTDVPLSPEQHLAGSFVLAAVKIDEVNVIRRLWGSYRKLIEREYREKMDEEVEKKSISIVANFIANLEHEKDSSHVREVVYTCPSGNRAWNEPAHAL